MENSKIAWTDHTFNPWVGCTTRVSEACENCYAAALAHRWGWDFSQPRVTKSWIKPLRWQRRAEAEDQRFRIFCGSMCDVFDAEVDPGWRAELWQLISETPCLDWFLLTKRPQNIPLKVWPNVWLGVTAENEERLKERGYWLPPTGQDRLFLSIEPMLGRITGNTNAFRWVILGCEKIGNRPGRPMREEWMREIVEGRYRPTFVKQMVVNGRVTDDPAEFPSWARRREFS